MNWFQEKTVKFIEEYKKLAVLWDIHLTDYNNNHAKLDALSDQLGDMSYVA